MFPREADEALATITRLRSETRRSLDRPWFALACFGTATMLSGAVIALAGGVGVVLFWVLAGLAGSVVMRAHLVRRSVDTGLAEPPRRWRLAVAMYIGCLVLDTGAGFVAGRHGALVAPMVAILLGYAVLGAVRRDPWVPLAVAPAVAVGIVLAVGPTPAWATELVFGAALVLSGAVLRATDPARGPR